MTFRAEVLTTSGRTVIRGRPGSAASACWKPVQPTADVEFVSETDREIMAMPPEQRVAALRALEKKHGGSLLRLVRDETVSA